MSCLRLLPTCSYLLGLAVVVGCDNAPKPTEAEGKPSATARKSVNPDDIKLQNLDYAGIEELIASKKGKVVVVDYWSTYCAPCLKEFPNLIALSDRVGPEQLACISVSLDYDGYGKLEEVTPKVLKFLLAKEATIDNVLASEESDAMFKKLDIPSIPAVFVYDRTGKLRKRYDSRSAKNDGPFSYEQVNKLVDELLAEKN
ncbi:MAG: TlpA disulfide reductase family protein [Planctomycetota bacterium]|nr:TlpA disulfide reductase family protein [Planctomycetota bacterium]